jgi:hypothetical protein
VSLCNSKASKHLRKIIGTRLICIGWGIFFLTIIGIGMVALKKIKKTNNQTISFSHIKASLL